MGPSKDTFSKKELQAGAQDYIVNTEKAGEHFRAQVHENDISKNVAMPKSCMAGISPELDNEARNIAFHFDWLKSQRFDEMTIRYSALLELFDKKIAQRPISEDSQSERHCKINKHKRNSFKLWFFKGINIAKGKKNSDDTIDKAKEILGIIDENLKVA